MFRNNILQVSFGYLQKLALQVALQQCIQNIKSTDTNAIPKIEDIRIEYENRFPLLTTPMSIILKKALENRDKVVKPHCHKPTLPFYATDGHYTKITLKHEKENNYLFFRVSLPDRESVELKFKIPIGKRFHKDKIKKICKPIVYINEKK